MFCINCGHQLPVGANFCPKCGHPVKEIPKNNLCESIDYYKANAEIMTGTMDTLGWWYTGGKNSPYVWVKCPDSKKSWDFFDELLDRVNVVCTPGAGFGACGEGFIRLTAFSTNENTREAMDRIIKAYKK